VLKEQPVAKDIKDVTEYKGILVSRDLQEYKVQQV
jgi:hypothetical protein